MRELRLAVLQLALARPDEDENIAAVARLVTEILGPIGGVADLRSGPED